MKSLVFLVCILLLSPGSMAGACKYMLKGNLIPRVNDYPAMDADFSYFSRFEEVPLSKIEAFNSHPVPNIFRMDLPTDHRLWIPINHIENLAKSIMKNGYDLRFPSQVFIMPDGRWIGFNGHHTREAMKLIGQETVPASIFIWSKASEAQKRSLRTYGGEFLKY